MGMEAILVMWPGLFTSINTLVPLPTVDQLANLHSYTLRNIAPLHGTPMEIFNLQMLYIFNI